MGKSGEASPSLRHLLRQWAVLLSRLALILLTGRVHPSPWEKEVPVTCRELGISRVLGEKCQGFRIFCVSIKPFPPPGIKSANIRKKNQLLNLRIMKTKFVLFALLLFGWMAGNTVYAQQATPRVSKRQVKQQQRIHHGVQSGEITKGEYVRLQKQQANVRKHKRHARADGQVTGRERVGIRVHQNQASRNIARKKHNQRKPR